MRNTMLTIIAAIACCAQAPALDIKAITGKPTANNPRYQDKEAWPTLAGDEYFRKEKWEPARLLIWNIHGEAKMIPGRRGGLDGRNPENWIDAATGKPAKSIPDRDTDIILPDSDTPYTVNFHCVKGSRATFLRHVTIGRNATIRLAGHPHRNSVKLFGNLWVRPTGKIDTYGRMNFIGDRHTFLRRDWPEDGVLKKMHRERTVTPYDPQLDQREQIWWIPPITYFFIHDKAPGKSTEVVGYVSVTDEVGINSGVFVVGRDSRFVNFGPAAVTVNKGAEVALMDGAQCSHGMNQFVCRDWNVKAGARVTGGTPDRPLKRDAYMGLGYRNWQNLPVPPAPKGKEKINTLPDGTRLHYGYGGYNGIVEGNLIAYPAEGSDARLVVCWQRIASGGAGSWGRHDEPFNKVFAKIPPKIGVWIGPDSMIENVRFDDLHLGGIVTESIETFRKWKNVSFGDACLSKDPEDLVRGYKAALAGQEKANPTSALPPKKPYITMPGKNGG